MRWLKHFTDVTTGTEMKSFLTEYGFDGYGKFWYIVEMIARNMRVNQAPSLSQEVEVWMNDLGMRRTSCINFLFDLQRYFKKESEWGQIQVVLQEPRDLKEDQYLLSRKDISKELLGSQKKDLIIVAIPKLKYLKDNYTKEKLRSVQS